MEIQSPSPQVIDTGEPAPEHWPRTIVVPGPAEGAPPFMVVVVRNNSPLGAVIGTADTQEEAMALGSIWLDAWQEGWQEGRADALSQ